MKTKERVRKEYNPELRAEMEKRWELMEAYRQSPQYKRKEKIAAGFIQQLLQMGASDRAAIEILHMALDEIHLKSYNFRAENCPETLAPTYLKTRTVWLKEIL